MQNILFALGKILPIFILAAIGYLLGKRKILDAAFSGTVNKLVFNFLLPAMIFESLYSADFSVIFSPKMIAIALGCTLANLLAFGLLTSFITKDRRSRAAMVQGAFRANSVIIALPIVASLFGPQGKSEATILIAFLVPVYNVFSVLVLSSGSGSLLKTKPLPLLKSIVTNPLTLGILAALPFSLLRIRLPEFMGTTIGYLSDMAVPLALLDIGIGLSDRKFGARPLLAVSTIAWKIIVTPIVFALAGIVAGLPPQSLGILFLIGSAPTAVTSYSMTKGMGGDSALMSDIILGSTVGSALTMGLGLFILKTIGLL